MTILITGANGTVSSAVLNRLAALPSVKARALVRDPSKAPDQPGVEVAVADLHRPETLPEAFAGVDTLWLLTAAGPHAPDASSNAVWAARQAGVGHIVRMSAIGAATDAPTRNGRLHALSDNEVRESGIPYTIIRPGPFAQNLFGSVANGMLFHNWGQARVGLIDVRDIADFAASVLSRPHEHAGKTYTITGPSAVSMAEVADTLTAVLGRPVAPIQAPDDRIQHAMIEAGVPAWVAEVAAHEYGPAYRAGWRNDTTDDFVTVVGRPPRTIAEFLRDHAAYLGGASAGT